MIPRTVGVVATLGPGASQVGAIDPSPGGASRMARAIRSARTSVRIAVSQVQAALGRRARLDVMLEELSRCVLGEGPVR
jgi:hypothetical protein